MKKVTLIAAALALTTVGCASSNDYKLYADTQRAVANAHRDADIARYQALSRIAETGDSTAKVTAIMGLNTDGANSVQRMQQVKPPEIRWWQR